MTERLARRRRVSSISFVAGAVAVAGVLVGSIMSVSNLPAAQARLQLQPRPPLPEGFADETVFFGLDNPIAVDFSPDGRVFVAEKSGIVKVFDDLEDNEPEIYADLRDNVFNANDRGLLGMTLHPDFPTEPHLYVLYSFNGDIGGEAPKWDSGDDEDVDVCPDPPGSHAEGCVISGRLSRLTPAGASVQEHPLVEGWCQQFPSHSVGDLGFLPDGSLVASGGDGAMWRYADYGQMGNPCNDPPGGDGIKPPSAEGGSLRSQDLLTRDDPLGLNGSIIRVDPMTGEGVDANPLSDDPEPNARRVAAYGLRNPFRFAVRPGAFDVYIADTGWQTWEEIDRLPLGQEQLSVQNYGWPCYEGEGRQPAYTGLGLNLCKNLPESAGGVTKPWFLYKHRRPISGNETCEMNGGAGSGIVFYDGERYPGRFHDGLFFTDYTRGCIWWMRANDLGKPDPSTVRQFAVVPPIVDLERGPHGDIYYVDITGTIGRFTFGLHRAPEARLSAEPRYGDSPLTVTLDASGSTDPNGNALSFKWDLDEDGTFDDATGSTITLMYDDTVNHLARVRVRNSLGLRSHAQRTISPGNTPPTVEGSSTSAPWHVGKTIHLTADISDQEEALGGEDVSWVVYVRHCNTLTSCHLHHLTDLHGLSPEFVAPDHEYPADLRVEVRVEDSRGLIAVDRFKLLPEVSSIRLESKPSGMRLTAGGVTKRAPFTLKAIVNSAISLSARKRQDGLRFDSWSDGGDRLHTVKVRDDPRTYTGRYVP